jgi:hypothetical protein
MNRAVVGARDRRIAPDVLERTRQADTEVADLFLDFRNSPFDLFQVHRVHMTIENGFNDSPQPGEIDERRVLEQQSCRSMSVFATM